LIAVRLEEDRRAGGDHEGREDSSQARAHAQK
jgi:hypothetical protein